MLSQVAYDKQRDEYKGPAAKPPRKRKVSGTAGFIAVSREKRDKVS